ncbi:MAG TPA: hypothetical protein PKN87_08700 [Syntrophomonadaceae bacterium]|mgnify:FL=1|nr:hypothetical protein [Syntrophomonadaceae bacterium]HPR93794.1 hypothetical protein [Syntrophomonadaceae bacterium]
MEAKQPKMMTIREIAATGLLPEHALRLMLKAGRLPVIFIGNKALVNYDRLCEQLAALGDRTLGEGRCGDED